MAPGQRRSMKLVVIALALLAAVAHGSETVSSRAAVTDDVPDSLADDTHSGISGDDETHVSQSSKTKKKKVSTSDDDSSDKKKKRKSKTAATTPMPTIFPTYAPTAMSERAVESTDDTVKYGVAGDDDAVMARTDAGDDGTDDVSNHPVGKRHKKNQENRDQGDDDIANPMQDDASSHAIFGKSKTTTSAKKGVKKGVTAKQLAAAQGVGEIAEEEDGNDGDDAILSVVDPDQLNNTAAYFPNGVNGTAETTTTDDAALADDHAAASTTCKSNDDCPRGSSGDIYRCIEGSCKDSGITATEGVYSPFDGDLSTDDWLSLAAKATKEATKSPAASTTAFTLMGVMGVALVAVAAAIRRARGGHASAYVRVAEIEDSV